MCLKSQETGNRVPRAEPMVPRRSSVEFPMHSPNGPPTRGTDASHRTHRLPLGRRDERGRSHGKVAAGSRLRPRSPWCQGPCGGSCQGPCGGSCPGQPTACGQGCCTAANTRCRKAVGAEVRCNPRLRHPNRCGETCCTGESTARQSQACQAYARDPGRGHTIVCSASHATCAHCQTSTGMRAKRSGSDPGNPDTRSRGSDLRQSAHFTRIPAAHCRRRRRHAGHNRIRCRCRRGSAGRHLDRPPRGARADRCRTERGVGCARVRSDRVQQQSVGRGR